MIPSSRRLLRITARQLQDGWLSFHPNKIPNVKHHPFKLVRFCEDGTAIVEDPELREVRP